MIKSDKDWKGKINEISLTRNLKLTEIECPCCHLVMITPGIYKIAKEVKKEYGDDIMITSCYRCDWHNMFVGGHEYSRHLYGEAIDLQPRKVENKKITELILNRYKENHRVITYEKENHLHIQTH